MPLLFSYGTLQQENVQIATFGRTLEGRPDELARFARSQLSIDDNAVVATSGEASHDIIAFTGQSADVVDGTLFEITDAELAAADGYEVAAYKRISVPLMSGARAWVYVDARSAPAD